MRIIGLCGSPRTGGNSETLLDQALKAAAQMGAETEKVRLSEVDIAPCTACAVCKQTGACKVHDGLPELRQKMEEADVYLFATPIYFWGASAQLKTFIDRWYSFQIKGQGFMRGKRAGLICTFNAKKPDTARHTVGMFEDAMRYLGVEFEHKLLVSAADLGDAANDDVSMARAYELGEQLTR